MMGVSTHSFFLMFWEMLWLRDIVGLVVKGMLFGFFGGRLRLPRGAPRLARRRDRRGRDLRLPRRPASRPWRSW